MKTITTARLILRSFKLSDLNDFFEYASETGVGENAGWTPHKSLLESEMILQKFLEEDDNFAIVLKETNKVIGSIGIHDVDSNLSKKNQKELGYVLGKPYWNKGYMSEAVKEVIKYCFEDLEIDVLWCCHFDFNIRSKRIIEKFGFDYYDTSEKEIEQLNYEKRIVLKYYMDREMYFSNSLFKNKKD